MGPLIGWAAPIIASVMTTVITTYLVAKVNQRFAESERKADAAKAETEAERKERWEWRNKVDATIKAILEAQCTQMRSDITHKIHRYMDDLHCASTEEKQSLWAEYEVYSNICVEYGIENHFVEQLVKQVMDLPDRSMSF